MLKIKCYYHIFKQAAGDLFYWFCAAVFAMLIWVSSAFMESLHQVYYNMLLKEHSEITSKLLIGELEILSNNIQLNSGVSLVDSGMKIKNRLSDILPTYMNYQILANNQILIDGFVSRELANRSEKILGGIFTIKLAMNNKATTYPHIVNDILIKALYTILYLAALFPLIKIYTSRKNKAAKILQKSEKSHKRSLEINELLLYRVEVQQFFQNEFIRRANAMYLENEFSRNNKEAEELFINHYSKKDVIFPLVLTGGKSSQLKVKDLIKRLRGFFPAALYDSKLEITSYKAAKLDIPCDAEVFYQIMLSLIFNLIYFMDKQGSAIQTLQILITKQGIELTHKGFRLNEETMISLSDSFSFDNKDVFILTCKKLFDSMKKNDIDYTIGYDGNYNTIKLTMPERLATNNSKPSNIVEFKK